MKWHAYGFDIPSFKLVSSSLSNRKERVKINGKFSLWEKIILGVPYGSILGPLLFSIFLCNLFLFYNDFDLGSYADDNALFCSENAISKVIERLEECSGDMFTWFENNGKKANSEKCYLYVSKKKNFFISKSNSFEINSNCVKIARTLEQKRFGVIIYYQLTFKSHICNI